MLISGIYGWYCTASDKWYVGQSKHIHRRKKKHIYTLNRGEASPHFQAAFNKYGEERFEFHILEETDNRNERECAWISAYRSNEQDFGYNLESGGGVNKILSQSTIEKMAQRRVGRRLTQQHRDNIGQSLIGHVCNPGTRAKISAGHMGKRFSAATRLKMSIAKQAITPETRARMSLAAKLWKRSPETGAKISKANLGRRNSAEVIKKMSESKRNDPAAIARAQKQGWANRGKKKPPISDQHREKLSQATKAYWAARNLQPA